MKIERLKTGRRVRVVLRGDILFVVGLLRRYNGKRCEKHSLHMKLSLLLIDQHH